MISGTIVTLLRNDSFISARLVTYAGVPAVFSDVAPEGCDYPCITVRTMIVSVKPHIEQFNVYIDYWDRRDDSTRLPGKTIANRIKNKLDGYRHRGVSTDDYTDLRFRFLSGYSATREEYNGIHYNLFFLVRANRLGWSKATSF